MVQLALHQHGNDEILHVTTLVQYTNCYGLGVTKMATNM